MPDSLSLIIRAVHILCGVFWAGAAFMLAGFIEPAITALGPLGGKFMHRMMGPGRFGQFMTAAGLLTAASGVAMLWLGFDEGFKTWFASGYGRAILAGSAAGLIALAVGLAVNAPTSVRIARIASENQPPGTLPGPDQLAEMTKLQRRLHKTGIISALLLALSVLAMAAARYL